MTRDDVASRWWLLIIVIAAVAVRLVLVLVLPFSAPPDERYRYGVTATIYHTNRTPRYGPEGAPSFVVKPILGYRLNAWVAHLAPDAVPLFQRVRLGSVVLSVVTIVLAYAAVRKLWPSRPWWATTLAAVLAFHPKFLGLGSYLNADAYTILVNTLVFYILTVFHRQGALRTGSAAALGGALGLVFLGRDNGYAGFIMVAVYLVWRLWHNWRSQARFCAVSVAIFLVFPTAFYLHQYVIYGKAFIPLVVGSGTSWVPPEFSVAAAYQSSIRIGYEYLIIHLDWRQPLHWVVLLVPLFTSSYLIYSFLLIEVPALFYSMYLLFFLGSVVGCVRHLRGIRPDASPEERSRRWVLVSAAAAGLGLLVAVARFNFTVLHQPDGRYLMPLIAPMMLFFVLGWRTTFRQAAANRLLTAGGTAFFVGSGLWSVWELVRLYA